MKAPTVDEVQAVLVELIDLASSFADSLKCECPKRDAAAAVLYRMKLYGIAQPIKVEGTIGGDK